MLDAGCAVRDAGCEMRWPGSEFVFIYHVKGVSTLLYHLPYLVVAFALPADELTIGDRINCHGVLEESVE